MIKSIKIKGFQSHKNTEIELSPNTNAIIGPSNNGKSAIFRSIKWVESDRPTGSSIINRNMGSASVEIVNDENTIVKTKNRKKGGNSYTLNGTELETSAPPPQVSSALNLGDINFQRQMEPHFLVFDPPGQVASYVRTVTKIDRIDEIIEEIKKRSGKNKSNISAVDDEIKSVKSKLESISKIPLGALKARMDSCKSLVTLNENTGRGIKELELIINQLRSIRPITLPDDIDKRLSDLKYKCVETEDQKEMLEHLKGLVKLLKDLRPIRLPIDVDSKMVELKTKHANNEKNKQELMGLENIVNALKATKPINVPDDLDDLWNEKNSLVDECHTLRKSTDLLFGIADQIQNLNENIGCLELEEKSANEELKELKSQLTECPTCGYELNEERKLKVCRDK